MSSDSGDLELGNYSVLHKGDQALWMLGKGGYGTTYKAEHKHLGRVCALKVINDNLMRNNDAKRRFLQEAQAAASLDHPHIARIYDFGEADGVFYYAMTYCAGGDLEEFSASRGGQPWSVVKELAQQILPALGMAHERGLLHRDLKPSNIMLADDDGTVSLRLIDFGLVKVLDHHESASTNVMLTQEGAFMGNPLTASPEQLREEDLDERSDLFSLGVTLWYLLAGSSPFGGISTAELVHQRLGPDSYDAMLPADLDDAGRQILCKLLSKNKEDRYASAGEVLEALNSNRNQELADGLEEGEVVGVQAQTSPTRDSLPAVAELAAAGDWAEIWEIHEQLKKFSYGTYYTCMGIIPGVPGTTLFVPDSESPLLKSVCKHADKILNTGTQLLNGFYQKGLLADEAAYVSPPFPTGDFQCLLQVVGHLNLQDHLPVFQQIGTAVDESIARDIPGVELEVGDVLLGLRNNAAEGPQSADEWHTYFQKKKAAGKDYVENIEVAILPKLVDAVDIEEAMVTLDSDDLATNPIARFGGLLYRSISGMSVKQSAYLSPAAHVSTSNISEESNRYLSEVIAARETPESAMHLLAQLCELEGVEWGTEVLDATLSAKDALKDSVTRTHASMSSLVSSLPAPVTPPRKAAKPPTPSKETKSSQPAAHVSLGQAAEPVAATTAATKAAVPQTIATAKSQSAKPSGQTGPAKQPSTAEPIAGREKKPSQSKTKWVIISTSIALCLALMGGLGYWFFGQGDQPKRNRKSGGGSGGGSAVPVIIVDNPVTLQFSDVVMDGVQLPGDASFSLVDHQGQALNPIVVRDGKAEGESIPADLFDDVQRWPIKLNLIAAGYTMPAVELKLADFVDAGNDRRTYRKILKLAPRAFIEISPRVKFNGQPFQLSTAMLKKHLHAEDPSVDWNVRDENGKISITLPPGESFPMPAVLTIPYMKELSFKLKGGEQPTWDLIAAQKPVQLSGLGHFSQMKFVPDFTKISDADVRGVLKQFASDYTVDAAAFANGMGTWNLPALRGKVEVTGANAAWSFSLSASAKFRVLTSVDRSGDSMEMGDAEFLKLCKLAEAGDASAQYQLGLTYLNGKGVGQNDAASTEWFRMAASRGDMASQHNLGVAYALGRGVVADPRKAVEWYSKAAKNKYPDSQAELAKCYRDGSVLPKNPKKAEELFLEAVKQGSAEAMYDLAVFYEDESLGMVDSVKATGLYQQAVELGHAAAMYNLALNYLNGEGGLERDVEKAKELLRKAAAKDNQAAKVALETLE